MSRILPVLVVALLLSYAVNDGRCGASPSDATRGDEPTLSISTDSFSDSLFAVVDTASALPTSQADNSGESCLFTAINPLCFGGIFTSPLPGTVVVHSDGSTDYTGGVFAHTGLPGTNPNAALIELTLENPLHCTQDDHCTTDNDEYNRNEDDDNAVNDYHQVFTRHGMNCTLTISSPTKLTRSGGTETMSADNYTISRTKGDISIGATLHVGANQVSGSYSGSFYVMLSYQ